MTAVRRGDIGPPPLARGPLDCALPKVVHSRSTPARAGTTRCWPAGGSSRTVHPRSRGDHVFILNVQVVHRGPPPLARGPRDELDETKAMLGSTPARAGTTRTGPRRTQPGSVHPRSRGDHGIDVCWVEEAEGPPPLARGPHLSVLAGTDWIRSTPARAGTTIELDDKIHSLGVHPRSRGDHVVVDHRQHRVRGPPPLARGPPGRGPPLDDAWWSTPARAGTTSLSGSQSDPTRVHPRSRGDHGAHPYDGADFGGPPPLARGPLLSIVSALMATRSTPARAGTTTVARTRPARARVHPRSRGDHASAISRMALTLGPPPLARGPHGRSVVHPA